ncbi:SRPBCC domain-containing protein [Micromonospora sp. WMMA1923]|uniref:SRPBCC domain-containing protein n=1 Tax=Micromonospora sp. WMMA1923 TaxID=3404125 RepID=UPI003B933999
MIDVTYQVSAVQRRVGTRTLPAGQARVSTISRTYDAAPEDVWDACTNPERIPRWFLPVTGDLRLHGRYQLAGNAGGTIERCDPPKGFTATWELGGEVSWIELRLTSSPDGGTLFELEHIAHVDDERWDQFGPAAVGVGWELGLLGLALHLTGGGAPVDPAEVATWTASEQGRGFITAAAERWGEADAAGGSDPAKAHAAAARTAAFYTGAEPA